LRPCFFALFPPVLFLTIFYNTSKYVKDKSILLILNNKRYGTNTFAVVVKSKDEDIGKAEAARKKNIPIYTVEEFKEKFKMTY
tara:strand:- start:9072 stop:9320 length:249 start_codon:yes stop_codon:yes gene_type:complete